MLAVDAGIASVVYTVIYAIIHLIFMALSKPFAMGHAGIFLAAFITGGFSFLVFRQASLKGKIQ